MTPLVKCSTVLVIVLSILTQYGLGLEILAIVTLPLHSHYMAFRTLFQQLSIRGHNVTVLNNYPDKDPPANLRFVDINWDKIDRMQTLEQYEKYDSTLEEILSNFKYRPQCRNNQLFRIPCFGNRYWCEYLQLVSVLQNGVPTHRYSTYAHLINIYRHISGGHARKDCEYLFESDNVKAHFAEGRKYDVIFVEQFMSDCGLAYAMTLYDAPIIGITSHTLLPFAYPRLGLPFDASADAFYFSNAGPNPSLFQKVENVLMNVFFTTLGRWYVQRGIYEMFDRYLPNNTLDLERDARSMMKMMFAYQHHSVTGARPLAPQLLEIGGIHIGKPKAVPKEVDSFLSDAKNGAIYVSFGSNLKFSTMSDRKRQEFLTAFKRLPYKVIWKYENASFTQENLYTGEWLPQLDILCHPKVLAFVSHGGMLSLSESTHCGKPLITVPFFGDQFSNAAIVRAAGLGITLYFDQINADTLEAAIRRLTTPEMQQNAQRISRLWHDRPMPVMDSAIYWTEYVARHKSAPPSLPSKHNTWFEGLLIDVAIVILAIIILIATLMYLVIKLFMFSLMKLFSMCSRKKEKCE